MTIQVVTMTVKYLWQPVPTSKCLAIPVMHYIMDVVANQHEIVTTVVELAIYGLSLNYIHI